MAAAAGAPQLQQPGNVPRHAVERAGHVSEYVMCVCVFFFWGGAVGLVEGGKFGEGCLVSFQSVCLFVVCVCLGGGGVGVGIGGRGRIWGRFYPRRMSRSSLIGTATTNSTLDRGAKAKTLLLEPYCVYKILY